MGIVVKKAISPKEILKALRARYRWFSAEGYPIKEYPCTGLEVDRFDCRTETVLYLAYDCDKLVGHFRAIYPRNGRHVPDAYIDAPYIIDFGTAGDPFVGQRVAAVGRFVLRPDYRGQRVWDGMLVCAAKDSLDRGVGVWHSGAYMGTNIESEALILHEAMVCRGWVRTDVGVTIMTTAKPEGKAKSFFRTKSEERLASIEKCRRFPNVIVADRCAGVEYVGKPYFEPDMNSYAHPFIVSVPEVLTNCNRLPQAGRSQNK